MLLEMEPAWESLVFTGSRLRETYLEDLERTSSTPEFHSENSFI